MPVLRPPEAYPSAQEQLKKSLDAELYKRHVIQDRVYSTGIAEQDLIQEQYNSPIATYYSATGLVK